MIRLLRHVWRDLRCLVTGTCPVFTGDEFTRWLERQRRMSEAARTNWWADDQFGGPPPEDRDR